VVRLLLDNKADIDAWDNSRDGAAPGGQADVNMMDNYGQTALYLAAMKEDEVMVRLLLEYKADVSTKDSIE
jgi:hypothetical protein